MTEYSLKFEKDEGGHWWHVQYTNSNDPIEVCSCENVADAALIATLLQKHFNALQTCTVQEFDPKRFVGAHLDEGESNASV